MPASVSFRVEGLREIKAAMQELGEQASNRILRSALNKGANPIVRRAKQLAPQPGPSDPYATGELRGAISKRLRRARRGSGKQTAVIGIERPVSRRAHFIEYGTAHQAAEPFLRPAADETQSEVLATMQQAMRVGVEREIKKLAAKHKTRAR